MSLRLTTHLILLCAAWVGASTADAAVECRVLCPADHPACLDPAGGARSIGGNAYLLDDCDTTARKVAATASVWYSRKTLLVSKLLAKGSELPKAVADGDSACPGWRCLFKLASGRVAGANPMGQGTEQTVSPAVMAAGLPYDEVAVAGAELSIRLSPESGAAKGGSLDLTDTAGRSFGPYPAEGGRVRVPADVLRPGEGYGYQWKVPGAPELRGSFMVARPGTVRRANAAASAAGGDAVQPSSANATLVRASAYLQVGLQWNAQQLIADLERGE